MYDLKGKVAIVTGAGRKLGIGRAIALRLAREGADVAVADICREFEEFPDYGLGMWEGLKSTADEVSALGVRGLPLKVDVTDSQAVDEMVAQTMDAFGHIDILVNNAGGVVAPMVVLWMEEAAWNKTLAINATGAFLCSQRVARTMIARREGGKIINIASIAGKGRSPALAAYCSAKAAVLALTRVLAYELAASGIQVNAVCPGEVDTDLQRWGWQVEANFRGVPYDEVVNEEIEQIPLGRLETTDDVANLVAFLASDQSDYMTGQAINVDGGIVMY
jgi:NAD(P)-dependent dehydrogenase (short-subunit alcohol dehydrogenase family)